MKFIMIFGPQAVGKMSVGEIISDRLKLPLFHNHISLDVIYPYIGWNETTFKLSEQLRFGIFNHIAKDKNHPGLIFTLVWNFDDPSDWEYVARIKDLFKDEMYFIELEATLETRLSRNKTENRLNKKPSKRDLVASEKDLLHSVDAYRLNSDEGEIKEKHYLRIDTTNKSMVESAQIILDWIGE